MKGERKAPLRACCLPLRAVSGGCSARARSLSYCVDAFWSKQLGEGEMVVRMTGRALLAGRRHSTVVCALTSLSLSWHKSTRFSSSQPAGSD